MIFYNLQIFGGQLLAIVCLHLKQIKSIKPLIKIIVRWQCAYLYSLISETYSVIAGSMA